MWYNLTKQAGDGVLPVPAPDRPARRSAMSQHTREVDAVETGHDEEVEHQPLLDQRQARFVVEVAAHEEERDREQFSPCALATPAARRPAASILFVGARYIVPAEPKGTLSSRVQPRDACPPQEGLCLREGTASAVPKSSGSAGVLTPAVGRRGHLPVEAGL